MKPQSEKHARRRHQNALRKVRARRVVGRWFQNPEKLADHLAHCSCYMCGNPRKWFGELTVGEKRAANRLEQGLSDLDEAA